MSDRFKFRLWNKYNKRLVKILCFWNEENTDYVKYIKKSSPHRIKKCNAIFEQCTGLKDKNGTLIYEGDIVRFEYLSKLTVQKVEWTEFGFEPIQIPVDYDELYINTESAVEVIGNIHENAELLV